MLRNLDMGHTLPIDPASIPNTYHRSRTVGKHDVTITIAYAPNQPISVSLIMRGTMSCSRRQDFKPSNEDKAKELFRELCLLYGMGDEN